MKWHLAFLTPASLVCVTVIMLGLASHAGGKRPNEKADDADHVALAALMLKDNHTDRAAAELGSVDPSAKGVDLPRYWLLMGLVALKRGDGGSASGHFERAMATGMADPMTPVFLAQARFQLGDCEKSIAALDLAGERAAAIPGTWGMRARCHEQAGHREDAFGALHDGLARHPRDRDLARQRVLLLVDMGLFVQATEEGQAYLEAAEASDREYAMISEAFIRSGQAPRAAIILEEARLRFPENRDIEVQLARAYLEDGRPLIAARIFRDLARRSPELRLDAAELYKRGGRPVQALYLNAGVADQKAKMRQRLGLLIELERYEEAAALGPRLARLDLLEEDAVTYALAYSLFQIGKDVECEAQLSRIRDPQLFAKAMELRRAMERCRASGWECEQGGAR